MVSPDEHEPAARGPPFGLVEPWSDLVTVVDLAERTAVRVRVRTGEPGVAVVRDTSTGEPVVVLRHRVPGEIETIGLRTPLDAGPHCPRVRGSVLPMAGLIDPVDHFLEHHRKKDPS